MNPVVKKVLPKVAGAIVRGPLKRLMDRRAAKGGKLVLWWRRTFGELEMSGSAAEQFVRDTETYRSGGMSDKEYARKYVDYVCAQKDQAERVRR